MRIKVESYLCSLIWLLSVSTVPITLNAVPVPDYRCEGEDRPKCVKDGPGRPCNQDSDCTETRCLKKRCVLGGVGAPCTGKGSAPAVCQETRCNEAQKCIEGGAGIPCAHPSDCPKSSCYPQYMLIPGEIIHNPDGSIEERPDRIIIVEKCKNGSSGSKFCTPGEYGIPACGDTGGFWRPPDLQPGDPSLPYGSCDGNKCSDKLPRAGATRPCALDRECEKRTCTHDRKCVQGGPLTGIGCSEDSDCENASELSCVSDQSSASSALICKAVHTTLACINKTGPGETSSECNRSVCVKKKCLVIPSPGQSLCQDDSDCERVGDQIPVENPKVDTGANSRVISGDTVPRIDSSAVLDKIESLRSTLGYRLGLADAAVQIDIFQDFTCGMCKRAFNDLISRTKEQFVDKGLVSIVFFDLPLGMNADAALLAKSAQCLPESIDRLVYFGCIYQNYGGDAELTVSKCLGSKTFDLTEAEKCMKASTTVDLIQRNFALAAELGIDGTPTILINGKEVGGALSFADFEALINAEIKRSP